ncbi:AAA family ATPase [Scytonema sp. UIC 10036]|uniref:nSTAND1 domain-containing NTPase n=1 Tax=Scytonema sp. UIC 10036 TaxID=2304196 RepID=UPI0012DA8DA2|nr:caspase family protein [Scytonema sp. UIC 10036]MUG95771.1 AAA family ATPase [Scytonema sp. UIC 10036]
MVKSRYDFKRNLAVVIGINEYSNGIPPLKTPVADAEKLANILQQIYKYHVETLLNSQATLSGLNSLLAAFKNKKFPVGDTIVEVQESDRILFYFAGHGIVPKDELEDDSQYKGYLIPTDAKSSNLLQTQNLLPVQDLHDALIELPCRHMLVILDCCFTGTFRSSSYRNAMPARKVYKQRYDRFISKPAWQVITSEAYDQKALDFLGFFGKRESEKTQESSPFASALFEALEGHADSTLQKGDGIITATEIYSYVRDTVEQMTDDRNSRQTPVLFPMQKHDKGEYIFLLPHFNRDKLEDVPALMLDNNPYRGLKSYEEKHSSLFFGRDELIQQLYTHISDRGHQLTVVLGVSGSGKSSLVKAGLIPCLRTHHEQEFYILPIIRPTKSPFGELAEAVLRNASIDKAEKLKEISSLKQKLKEAPSQFIALIEQYNQVRANTKLLLIIDQFEELCTICEQQKRQSFLTFLAQALEADPRLHIVLTLRSDFEPRFTDFPLRSYWRVGRFQVKAMKSHELRQAIERPAMEKMLDFEPPTLVDLLIDEVGQMPGALSLLSFTLSELYIKCVVEERRTITQKDYAALGGVIGSLRQRATEEYDKFDSAHQATLRRVMLRMVTIEDEQLARRRVPLWELKYVSVAENERVETILNHLDRVRLVVKGQDIGGEPYVEPVHDAFVLEWDKIRTWVEQERENLQLQRRLTCASQKWQEHNRSDEWLWGRQLQDAPIDIEYLKRMLRLDNNPLNQLETEFARASLRNRPYFTLSYHKNDNSWVIDGGTRHGLKSYDNGETILAFFPFDSTIEELRNLDAALGEVRVTQVLAQRSTVQVIRSEQNLAQDGTYKAVIINVPLPPLKIYFNSVESDAVGIELVQRAIQTAAPGEIPSLYLSQVNQSTDADYHLIARNNQFWIVHPQEQYPIVAPIPESPDPLAYSSSASQVVTCLENIARWTNVLQLSTLPTSQIEPDDVEVEITFISGREESSSNSDIRVEYSYDNEEWQSPVLQVRLTNRSDKTLYANVVLLSDDYAISADLFEEKDCIRLAPSNSEGATSVETEELAFYIPEAFLEQGITEYKDIFKLIVCTTEFNASLLQQDGLNPIPGTRSVEYRYRGTLNRLFEIVNSRYSREAITARGTYDDWMAKQVTVTMVRPQDAVAIRSNKSSLLQNGLVEVQPHPSLRAKVNLTTVPQARKDLGNLILPPLLQESGIGELFKLTSRRGSDPGLSGLELSDIEDYTSVNKEAPLKLVIDKELAENEHILPFAYDGEDQFFLPLGPGVKTNNRKTEITIERLPTPSTSSRSLQGSIKIFFAKVIYQKFNSSFTSPLLRSVVEVEPNNNVIYEANQENIKVQVAQAQKIVLFIHGIIGNSESIVPSINKAIVDVDGQKRSLKELYDLVLTFDYENRNHELEENASLLKQRLEAVGLVQNHSKELHIIAHSIGGLLARWFIEREGGHQVVQHLIMIGTPNTTPNAGAPLPDFKDWVTLVLTLGLNAFSTVSWSTQVVGSLIEATENTSVPTEPVDPGSKFLRTLAASRDPGIPYTIVAGNASVLSPVLQEGRRNRLMQKLFGSRVPTLPLFRQPNDLAATVESMTSIPEGRSPHPTIIEVACDHFTYFTHSEGLTALGNALLANHSQSVTVKTYPTYITTKVSTVDTTDLAVGQELILSLNLTPIEQPGSQLIRVPVNTLEITIYIEAPGFFLQGEHTYTLPVVNGRLEERSLSVELLPLLSGNHTIQISVYPGGRLSNLIPVKLQQEVRISHLRNLPNIPELIDRRAIPDPQPDVMLYVSLEEVPTSEPLTGQHRVGLYFTCPLLGCDREPLEPLTFTIKDLERLRQSVIQAASVANGSPVDILTSLRAIGFTLSDQLMPHGHKLRDYYYELLNFARTTSAPLSWLIVSEPKAVLPWELTCAYYYIDNGEIWHDDFLAQRFIVAHWVGSQGFKLTSEAPLAELGFTHYNQRSEHLVRWQKVLQHGGEANSNEQSGLQALMQPDSPFYGLHILRYTELQQTGKITSYQESSKLLPGKTLTPVEELLYTQQLDFTLRRPVIGLSLVDGQPPNTGMVLSKQDNQLEADWMLPLMYAGASALVGSRWTVLPEADQLFFRTFYDLIRKGTDFGSSVWQSREQVRLAFPNRSDWLAYTYFGHPRCEPYIVRASQGFTFFEAINPPNNDRFQAGKEYRFRASYRREAPVWYKGRLHMGSAPGEGEKISVMVVLVGDTPFPTNYEMERVANGDSYQCIVPLQMPDRATLLPVIINFQKGEEQLNNMILNLTVVTGE